MIRAWCFREDEPAANDIALGDLAAHVAQPGCLVWVDCDDPSADEISLLAVELGIHDLTAEDLVKAQQRTKLERYADHYHVALRDCRFTDGRLVTSEVDVVFSNGWLLSVRHTADGHVADVDEARQRFERRRDETGSNDEGFLLWAILDTIVDRYFTVHEAIDDRLDVIEEIVFTDKPDGIPREMFSLRRDLVSFRRVVGPLREVLSEILRREIDTIDEPAIVHMQDVYDHVLRVLDLVESQRELLTGLLEGQLAVQSNRMNQVMKATSSWGAILIVATLIAGIYGMNFRHMPELGWQYGYPAALGSMLVVTGILYLVFKRRGWL